MGAQDLDGPSTDRRPTLEDLEEAGVVTPAYVYDLGRVAEAGRALETIARETSVRFTYSVKACALPPIVDALLPFVSGYSVSSLFEARLVSAVLGRGLQAKSLHVTAPAYHERDLLELDSLCSFVVFNSLTQYDRHAAALLSSSPGLRINPGLSFVEDERYDPCRRQSKLGVPVQRLKIALDAEPRPNIQGLHFHSNSGSSLLEQLLSTARELQKHIPELLRQVSWVNMGGGYHFDRPDAAYWIREARNALATSSEALVFMEPGEFVVGEAGFLATRVLDIVDNGDTPIAVVDGSVNHVPECFEYQFEPDALGHQDEAPHEYLVAGASCLSGDLFGQYRFPEPLAVGDLVVFSGVGAYSMVRANAFTGIPLPRAYVRGLDGALREWNSYSFAQYQSLWTED